MFRRASLRSFCFLFVDVTTMIILRNNAAYNRADTGESCVIKNNVLNYTQAGYRPSPFCNHTIPKRHDGVSGCRKAAAYSPDYSATAGYLAAER